MKKTERIAELVAGLGGAQSPLGNSQSPLDPRYTGYFLCFNQQRYYEAHDVLEDLWLAQKDAPQDADSLFYKALIQVAGALVHLQKQRLRPDHPKDGRRTRPAARLFQLAAANLAGYRPVHLQLDVQSLINLCLRMKAEIEHSGFSRNPWDPARPPILELSQ